MAPPMAVPPQPPPLVRQLGKEVLVIKNRPQNNYVYSPNNIKH